MNTNQPRLNLSRRDFLKILGFAGVAVAGGYVLSEYTPWLDYAGKSEDIWMTPEQNTNPTAQMRTLVHYATLAANGHNTQPWKFSLKENVIEIFPDYSRQLAVVDSNHRELWISLGCALENLVIAARAEGFTTNVTYPDAAEVIKVELTPDTRQSSPLFDAISSRQNTRSEYNGQAVKSPDFDQLQALPLEPGVALHFVTTPANKETVLEYVNQGNLSQYGNQAFLDELIYWLRFNKKEALAALDGLYSRCSGNPEVPRWLGKMFVAGTKPQQQADADAKKLRSSPGAVVIASAADGKTAWVRTGQVYERLALKMTSLNIKSAFLNQPIEVAEIRSQFQKAVGLGSSHPQLLLRFGYAEALPHSLRRPVDQVVI
jgi:hypothetical protein